MKVQEEAKKPYSAGGIFSKKSGGLLGLVLASLSLCPKGWASSVQVFIDRADLYAPGGGVRRGVAQSGFFIRLDRIYPFLSFILGVGTIITAEPEYGKMMMASSGGSGSSNSTSWTGKTAFEEQVLMESFPETDTDSGSVNQPEARPALPANQVASPGAAQEALPQAPAPAEVAHPAPDQEERAALREEVKTLIVHQFQEESKKAQGVRLSVLFPEMTEVYSSAAESRMSYDLEIPRETDAESLREWREKIRDEPNLLKPLIKDHLPKRGGSTYPEKLSAYECGFDPSEKKNGARTVLELRINVPRSKEYARVFQREHQKNLIQLHPSPAFRTTMIRKDNVYEREFVKLLPYSSRKTASGLVKEWAFQVDFAQEVSIPSIDNFLSIKLTQTNYLLWKTKRMSFIEAQDLLNFVDGTGKEPKEFLETDYKGFEVYRKIPASKSRQLSAVSQCSQIPDPHSLRRVEDEGRFRFSVKRARVVLNLLAGVFSKKFFYQQRSLTEIF
ncbi:hypothetical protein FNV43_RR08261 [Rhamnella rubrinervis]|uniref:Uncharacterized protein n=1 Tax=Rhamnella rubrinervis TaxID=2594499 RepID=A0A8K0HHG3_9ROSA|nr:hypothetical protein FNV43_RR08261 [Rhamnella rubrinervis]